MIKKYKEKIRLSRYWYWGRDKCLTLIAYNKKVYWFYKERIKYDEIKVKTYISKELQK